MLKEDQGYLSIEALWEGRLYDISCQDRISEQFKSLPFVKVTVVDRKAD